MKTIASDVLTVLSKGYGIKVLGSLNTGSIYLRPGFDGDGGSPGCAGRMWFVCDNGGELNVGPVNLDDELRSVAITERGGSTLDAGTIGYRVAMVIRGQEIDYDVRWPELIGELAEIENTDCPVVAAQGHCRHVDCNDMGGAD